MVGCHVRLEPLLLETHGNDLQQAFDLDKEGKMWTYLPKGPFNGDRDGLNAWLKHCEQSDDPMFFAIVSVATDKALGLVSYMRMDPANGVMEVGCVTLSPALAGTVMSTEFQYLMMTRCFDELGYRRYEWKCDSLNEASRRAATRLGFTFEGTFRQACIYKQRNRDTSWFSMLDSEWPVRKEMFETWLNPSNFDDAGKQLRRLQQCKPVQAPMLADVSSSTTAPAAHVVISEAGLGDAADIEPLFVAYREFYKQANASAGTLSFIESRINENHSTFLLARSADKAVGIATCYFLHDPSTLRKRCLLNDLFVNPHARGLGVGTALLNSVSALAKQEGCSHIVLRTAVDNIVAQRLYKRCGYGQQKPELSPWDWAPASNSGESDYESTVKQSKTTEIVTITEYPCADAEILQKTLMAIHGCDGSRVDSFIESACQQPGFVFLCIPASRVVCLVVHPWGANTVQRTQLLWMASFGAEEEILADALQQVFRKARHVLGSDKALRFDAPVEGVVANALKNIGAAQTTSFCAFHKQL